jgi:hypothetical protein
MRMLAACLFTGVAIALTAGSLPAAEKASPVLEHKVKTIKGEEVANVARRRSMSNLNRSTISTRTRAWRSSVSLAINSAARNRAPKKTS